MISFKTVDTHLFKFDDDTQDLFHVKTESQHEHEKEVTDFDCFPEKNIIISGSIDGYVKVWNFKKELIREIKFPEPVYSVSFLNEAGDILVGHLGKVSTVSCRDYQPFEVPKLADPGRLGRLENRGSMALASVQRAWVAGGSGGCGRAYSGLCHIGRGRGFRVCFVSFDHV